MTKILDFGTLYPAVPNWPSREEWERERRRRSGESNPRPASQLTNYAAASKAVRKIKKAPSSDFYRQYELNGVLKQLREGRDSTALPWPWEAR